MGRAVNPDGTPNDRAGKPDMWTGSCHIMQLKQHSDGTDFDPREPENWTVPEAYPRHRTGEHAQSDPAHFA